MSETTTQKKKMGLGKKLLIGLGVILVIGALNRNSDTPNSASAVAEVTEAAPVSEVAEGLTMEKYSALKNGMSYRQVVAILGSEGKEISSNDIADIHTVMYQWEGTGFSSNMNAMFQNDKMMSKAQFGLE